MKRKLLRLACLGLALFSALQLIPLASTGISWLAHQARMATDPSLTGAGFVVLQPVGMPPLWVSAVLLILLLAASILGVILLRPRKKEN